jgi:hypothetical protein
MPRVPKITAFSQIINLLIFAVFALSTRYYTTIVFQSILIIFSLFICRKNLSEFRLRELTPLLPILLFVLIMNCFRGSGEVLMRIGPFMIVRQGLLRGIYYLIVITQLWLISKVLTKGFGEDALLSSLYTIDSIFNKSGKKRSLFIILFYILRIFRNTYAELKVLLKKRSTASAGGYSNKRSGSSSSSMRERILLFFYSSFERSKEEFESSSKVTVKKQPPVVNDYLYIFSELGCITLAYIFRSWLIAV